MGKAFVYAQEGNGYFDSRGEAGGNSGAASRQDNAGAKNGDEVDGLAQLLDNLVDVVLLEQADRGNAGGSRFQAGISAFQSNST